jgi:hypothetical protein
MNRDVLQVPVNKTKDRIITRRHRLEKVVSDRYVMGYRTRQDVEVHGEEGGWCCF